MCKVTLLRCLLLALQRVPSFVRPACGRVWALGWGQVSGTCPALASLSVGWGAVCLSGPQFPPVQRGAGFCTQRSRPHQPLLTFAEAPFPAPMGSLGPHMPALVCSRVWHGAAWGPVWPASRLSLSLCPNCSRNTLSRNWQNRLPSFLLSWPALGPCRSPQRETLSGPSCSQGRGSCPPPTSGQSASLPPLSHDLVGNRPISK